jgi:hypothetical protein
VTLQTGYSCLIPTSGSQPLPLSSAWTDRPVLLHLSIHPITAGVALQAIQMPTMETFFLQQIARRFLYVVIHFDGHGHSPKWFECLPPIAFWRKPRIWNFHDRRQSFSFIGCCAPGSKVCFPAQTTRFVLRCALASHHLLNHQRSFLFKSVQECFRDYFLNFHYPQT